MQCSNCGAKLPENARFCPKCGKSLVPAAAPASSISEEAGELTVVFRGPAAQATTAAGAGPKPPASESSEERITRAKNELTEQRTIIPVHLLTLLPFVGEPHLTKNNALFEAVLLNIPPLEDAKWGEVAFVTGMYGSFMWKHPLNASQKRALWQALVWSIHYERFSRPKQLTMRVQQLSQFFKGCDGDAEFLSYALTDINVLIDDLDANPLKRLKDALLHAPTSPLIVQLCQKIDQRMLELGKQSDIDGKPDPSSPDISRVVTAIEHLWSWRDKKYEGQDRETLEKARRERPTPKLLEQLAKVAGVISKNVVYRYAHTHGGSLTDEQLRDAILLANFAVQYSPKELAAAAQRNLLLLDATQRMLQHVLDAQEFSTKLKEQFDKREQAEFAAAAWSDLIAIVSRHLAEHRKAGMLDTVEAEAWVRVFASVDSLNPSEREQFITEVQAHNVRDSLALKKLQEGGKVVDSPKEPECEGPLSFLGDERCKEFRESILNNRLDRVSEILREARPSLLSALSRVLADRSFREFLPPRRAIRIGGKNELDRFPEARQLIMSQNPNERQRALTLFEQAARDTLAKDYVALAREWLLFAQARVFGAIRVVADWETDRSKRTASWEEIWNLAVFYIQMRHPAEALEVLKPGLKELKAPFAYLRFALYCAVQMLEQPAGLSKEMTNNTVTFLFEHLTKLPLPECYLASLLLVEEAQIAIDLLEQSRILGIFQELLSHPITIPNPEQRPKDTEVEAFEQDLRRLRLEETWQLWINDYAMRNPRYYKAWFWLSEANELASKLDQAEAALQHVVDSSLRQYRQPLKSGDKETELHYLRMNLIRLFEFYRRALPHKSEMAFNQYYMLVPKLWDGSDGSTTHLINVTRQYLDKIPLDQKKVPGIDPWPGIHAALAEVRSVEGLKDIQTRLNTAIDLIPTGQRVVRDRAAFMKELIARVCELDATMWRKEELQNEVNRLNQDIKKAHGFVEQEPDLQPLKALVAAFERIFKDFSNAQRLAPRLQVDPAPLGGALPDDLTSTTLVIRVFNPGPGEITQMRASCSDKGVIASSAEGVLERVVEQSADIVAIPVIVDPHQGDGQVQCFINLTYQWGILKDLTSRHPLSARWFSFQEFLQQHGTHSREIPIPYVFDKPIDFKDDDKRLFQGRDNELDQIRTTYLSGRIPGIPQYFHGIRRVGKTSLLRRIVLELQQGAFFPIIVELPYISPAQQTFPQIINAFTERILKQASEQGLDLQDISPVAVDHPNPLVGVEAFFEAIRERTGDKRLILLLDEFQVIVAKVTTPLLDLIRHVHQRDLIWFIMSGWMRPEPMRHICPDTQLFPLKHYPVDFLPLEEVKKVLRLPMADYGVQIPDATVRRLYVQTAGNPNLVAKIAWYGIARLNADHRIVLAPQDVDDIAAQLAGDPGNFTSSSLSPLILSTEELKEATRFAKALKDHQDQMPIEEAYKMFNDDILQQLEEKYILELQEGGRALRLKGKMLATFLRNRLVKPGDVPGGGDIDLRKRVGIFVDYENMLGAVPSSMGTYDVGVALVKYAEQYGNVVCKWASADPKHLPNPATMRLDLEAAGFDVRFPREELQRGLNTKNVADFVLLECMTDESTHRQPEIYIIVSGDRDYYERVASLLDGGYTVRILASKSSQSSKYTELNDHRLKSRYAAGYTDSDLFIDNLEDILSGKMPRKTAELA